jgi:hypothetical protein
MGRKKYREVRWSIFYLKDTEQEALERLLEVTNSGGSQAAGI